MSLRELAESDLAGIVEDGVTGFGWGIILTAPDKQTTTMTGLSNDISQVIDPGTGMVISGSAASVALRLSTLDAAGIGRPVGIADSGSKPWIVQFLDINGSAYTFKVKSSDPDRALGLLVCILEAYVP